jgi:molecular chaperone GrpE
MTDEIRPDDEAAHAEIEAAVEEVFDERPVAERERDEFLADLQRLQADFENYRKRVARDADDAATRAAGSLVAKMLPVLDAFDQAAAHFATNPGPDADAFSQTRTLLLDTLGKEGLERVGDVDVDFDPAVHEAVLRVDGDDGRQVVAEMLRAGYLWKGSVLRPAMVKVRG